MAVPYSRYLVYPLPWYSFLILLGIVLAIILAVHEQRRKRLPEDTVIDLALRIVPFGIIGARLYYVLFSWDSFKDNPLSILYIWEGGIAIYGAIIAGFIVLVFFSRKRSLPVLTLCDVIAPGLVLAQSIGRWGNYFNMEAYGLPVTAPAFCFFPFAVLIPDAGGWHLATFFYESIWNLFVFLFLWFIARKRFPVQGHLFYHYLALYAAGRMVIEELRMDSLYSADIRVSQLFSAFVCLLILIRFFIHAEKTKRHSMPSLFVFPLGIVALLCAVFISFFPDLFVSHSLTLRIGLLALSSFLFINSLLIMTLTGSREKKYADNEI